MTCAAHCAGEINFAMHKNKHYLPIWISLPEMSLAECISFIFDASCDFKLFLSTWIQVNLSY